MSLLNGTRQMSIGVIIIDSLNKNIRLYENGDNKVYPLSSQYLECLFSSSFKSCFMYIFLGKKNTKIQYEEYKRRYCHTLLFCELDYSDRDSGIEEILNIRNNEIIKEIKELKDFLNCNSIQSKEISFDKNKNVVDVGQKMDEIIERVKILDDRTRSIEFSIGELDNLTNNESFGVNSVITELQTELSEYKKDFYFKSMQKYGVNIMIEILKKLYEEKHSLRLLNQDQVQNDFLERIERIIVFCKNRAKKMNVLIEESSNGDIFDGKKMIAYDDDCIFTNEECLKGRVASSISPAFYWILPRVNAPIADYYKLMIEEEIVVLYK